MFGQQRQVKCRTVFRLRQGQMVVVDLIPAQCHRLSRPQPSGQQEAIECRVNGVFEGIDGLLPCVKVRDDALRRRLGIPLNRDRRAFWQVIGAASMVPDRTEGFQDVVCPAFASLRDAAVSGNAVSLRDFIKRPL